MRPELLQAARLLQRNTPQSLEEAVGLLQSTVFSFSMKVCGHPQDAEDTSQEVLFRSLGHLAKIQDPQALAVWLYTVTRNRCWRMRRRPAHAPARTLSLDELMPGDAELGRLLEDPSPGPEALTLRAEQHQLLHQAVLGLPAPLRIVLVLHDMEELNTDQVAQVLGLQPGTVRVRLHRARLGVRQELGRILNVAPALKARANSSAAAKGTAAKHRKRPTACRELFASLSEFLDGRVGPRACRQMTRHIEGCPSCVAFLRDLRAAVERCRSLQVPCDPRIAARLRATLTREVQRMTASPPTKKISARM
ncbi:MAG TPA: sigma-70 family RNA polymerase sigma factor [Terracidiphilus sp.]|nr:sigma-70 family RNA polymerase sigma factor [Terracidiphilus sp.]